MEFKIANPGPLWTDRRGEDRVNRLRLAASGLSFTARRAQHRHTLGIKHSHEQ